MCSSVSSDTPRRCRICTQSSWLTRLINLSHIRCRMKSKYMEGEFIQITNINQKNHSNEKIISRKLSINSTVSGVYFSDEIGNREEKNTTSPHPYSLCFSDISFPIF
uniref:Uncharacterized protein n=1 Tax=Taenia asiatica TaxID=60517 RepID=A0A0R3W126_TAEAS